MLELNILPDLQLLKEFCHVCHRHFDGGTRLSWLCQDREIEEIVSVLEGVIPVRRSQQGKKDFAVTGDLV